MPKMLLVFSHELTEDQEEDAKNALGVNKFLYMPDDIKRLWINIPPTLASLKKYLQPVKSWIKENAEKGDYVLIHGDFGAVYLIVNYAFSQSLIPIYATTERKAVEKTMPDGIVKIERIFKHKMFRRYEKGGCDE